jgi:copper chaperone CopZ
MKKLILIIVFTLFSISLVYAGTEYQLGVDGVACPFCVYGIEKQLSKLEGIERIETDIEKSLVLLIMKEGFVLNESSVNETVTKAGFSLRSFTLSDKAE